MEETKVAVTAAEGEGFTSSVKVVVWVCFVVCAVVMVLSLLGIFLYAPIAGWFGSPYSSITLLNPILVRSVFALGTVVYAFATWGCYLMLKARRKGFKIFVVPAVMLYGASLIFVFNNLIILQLLIITITLLSTAFQIKKLS
jgi:hypothetical protein